MTTTHNFGFPRIGAQRELKFATEQYWRREISQEALQHTASELRKTHWQLQADQGIDLIPVGDFSFYDHVLDLSALLGCVPPRFEHHGEKVDLDTVFRMARGQALSGKSTHACEMTKWFDTNYHYIVPEFYADTEFALSSDTLFEQVAEAQALGHKVKPVLLGPLSWLWLGKSKSDGLQPLDLLDKLIPVYGEILNRLAAMGVEWVQIDEPILVLDLPQPWKQAFEKTYNRLQQRQLNILLATYFGALEDNVHTVCNLPVAGIHIDAVESPEQIDTLISACPAYKIISLGVIDGRNVWRSDLPALLNRLEPLKERLGERLWLAPSCSLLHVPVDLDQETELDSELRSWLSFATQKLAEISALKVALEQGRGAAQQLLFESAAAARSRRKSPRIHNAKVAQRLATISDDMTQRHSPYSQRSKAQQARLQLPLFPTTTIGSFPQTAEIRSARRDFKAGSLDEARYTAAMKDQIKYAIEQQENYGLDVLVHGEAERNDMVEYFGEQLQGYAFTRFGWVQSYGSRCVKPPIIYGDISRPKAMTVEWARYAQSLTSKPVKGMLTGPVTLLNWSFVRDDQPRATTCLQLALAIRDEVQDLEAAGIRIIQIDEAALREKLPLRKSSWQHYLNWAVQAFRLCASGVDDSTQIHTHMCYSEFNDIIEAVADMDADVITIETSRSDMELLDAFVNFHYPNEIGPGVYDIHSPNVPTVEQMVALIEKAATLIPAERLWVNPDCGLKTRGWKEVGEALQNMVAAAETLRQRSARETG